MNLSIFPFDLERVGGVFRSFPLPGYDAIRLAFGGLLCSFVMLRI